MGTYKKKIRIGICRHCGIQYQRGDGKLKDQCNPCYVKVFDRKQPQKEKRKKYYQKNKDLILVKVRNYRTSEKGKKLSEERKKSGRLYQSSKKSMQKHKDKFLVRLRTTDKYKELPDNFEFHHITTPYHVDFWIGMQRSDHSTLHRIIRENKQTLCRLENVIKVEK